MSTQWDDTSWQKDFLNMKSHSPSDAKLLIGGVKGLKDAWRLGVLHVEYERLKKKQEQQQKQKLDSKYQNTKGCVEYQAYGFRIKFHRIKKRT